MSSTKGYSAIEGCIRQSSDLPINKDIQEIVLTTEDLHDLLGKLFIIKKIKNKEIKIILSDERI